MAPRHGLLILLPCLALALSAVSRGEDTPPRTDLYGDPLPPGAVARLGSVQLRHAGLGDLTFAPDGKTLVSAGSDRVVRFWDAATGKAVRAVRLQSDAGPGQCVTLSPDGKLYVCCDAGKLILWDTASGKEIRRLPGPAGQPANYVSYLFFSPDNRWLVVAWNAVTVTLWDLKEGKERALAIPTPGNTMVGGDSSCHACFSPDSKLLVTAQSAQIPLCVWDVAAGTLLQSFDAGASISTFSPDSKQLAVVSSNPGGKSTLRLYEASTGKEVLQTGLNTSAFTWWLSFAPDGKSILAVQTEGALLVECSTGKELRRFAPAEIGRQRIMLFSPDGRLLVGQGTNRIRVWEAATGKELHARPGRGELAWAAAYSPDGRQLALSSWGDPELDFWDPTTGQHVRRIEVEDKQGYVRHFSFSQDGRTLFAGRLEGILDVFDVTAGKRQRRLNLREPGSDTLSFHPLAGGRRVITLELILGPRQIARACVWEADPPKRLASQEFTAGPQRGWAPLGTKVAFLTADGIAIADGAGGRFDLRVSGIWGSPLAASPDHRLLAAPLGVARKGSDPAVPGTYVWEVLTGKQVALVATGRVAPAELALDGRTLVSADRKSLRLWDLATGKERHSIAFPEDVGGFARGLYLAPDGRHATTGMADGTMLVWELPPRPIPAAEPVGEEQLARLWTDLGAEDASRAYAAIWKLADSPAAAVTYLGKQLKPVADENADRVRRLLHDIDSEDFTAREEASKELEKLGNKIAPALHAALEANPSPEAKRRLEGLLDKVAQNQPSSETQRRLRAMQVLEQIGSAEARRILEVVAGGAAGAWETDEAKAALARLKGG